MFVKHLLLKLKYSVIIKKKKVELFLNSSSSITYILLNNSNIFLAVKADFYFDRLSCIVLCVYDTRLV